MSRPPRRIDALLVAEKNSVAKAFAKLTSDGGFKVFKVYNLPAYEFSRNGEKWVSFGVSGHLMDFDFEEKYNRWHAVDPRKLFEIEPRQVIRSSSIQYVKALEFLGKLTNYVVLALDADTEGESIAFEVMDIIRRVNPRATFRRAWFSALTKKDLERALNELRDPNPLLANKSFARMRIDLTIGAAFTRALTLLVERRSPRILPKGSFLSYGPCQTPVLHLVVSRALQRENFKSETYYSLSAQVRVANEIIKMNYKGEKIKDSKIAKELYDKVAMARFGTVVVAEYLVKEEKPPEPLNTVELERRASKFLNLRPKEALDLAEELYRDGLISYPRTETTIYPPTLDLKGIALMLMKNEEYRPYIEKELLPQKVLTPTRGKEDDKAHPPIYPTRSASKDYVVKKFGVKGWKLYDFIVRHFLATISKPALIERQKLEVDFAGVKFETYGSKVIKQGYFEIYPFERVKERPLPKVLKGTLVYLTKLDILKKKTEPPPYLSESELLKLMKRYGIGTDATMQEHIHTNIKRKYFIVKGKRCIPTPLGKTIAVTLYSIVPEIVRPEVRGAIEQKLQEIALGRRSPEDVVEEVKREFIKYYDKLASKSEEVAERLIKALKETYYGGEAKARSPKLGVTTSPKISLMTAKEYFGGVNDFKGIEGRSTKTEFFPFKRSSRSAIKR